MGTDQHIVLFSIVIGFVAFLICFLHLLFTEDLWEKHLARKWSRQGGRTEGYLLSGRIIRYEDPRRKDDALFRVVYSYEVAGEQYKTVQVLNGDYPRTVTIYYNPRTPGACYASNGKNLTLGIKRSSILWLMAIVGVSVAASYLGLKRLLIP